MDQQEQCTLNNEVQETREFTPGKPPLNKLKAEGKALQSWISYLTNWK